MYDKSVCAAGLGFCLVIGGTVLSGWYVLGIALALVIIGVVVGRYLYNRTTSQDDE